MKGFGVEVGVTCGETRAHATLQVIISKNESMSRGHVFNITQLKQRYKELQPGQRWVVIAGGAVLVAILLIAGGQTYHSITRQSGQTSQSALFREAQNALQEEDYQRAAKLFGQYGAQTSGEEERHAQIRRANVYERAEQYQDALAAYREAERKNDRDPEVVSGVAYTAREVGNLELAITYFGIYDRLLKQQQQTDDSNRRENIKEARSEVAKLMQDLRTRRVDELVESADERLDTEEPDADAAQQAIQEYTQAIKLARDNPGIGNERIETYEDKRDFARDLKKRAERL